MTQDNRQHCRRFADEFLAMDNSRFQHAYQKIHGTLADFELVPEGMPSPEQLRQALEDVTATATYIRRDRDFNPERVLESTGPVEDYTHTFSGGTLISDKPLVEIKAVGIIVRAATLIKNYGQYSGKDIKLPPLNSDSPSKDDAARIGAALMEDEYFSVTLLAGNISIRALEIARHAEFVQRDQKRIG